MQGINIGRNLSPNVLRGLQDSTESCSIMKTQQQVDAWKHFEKSGPSCTCPRCPTQESWTTRPLLQLSATFRRFASFSCEKQDCIHSHVTVLYPIHTNFIVTLYPSSQHLRDPFRYFRLSKKSQILQDVQEMKESTQILKKELKERIKSFTSEIICLGDQTCYRNQETHSN